MLTLTNAGKSDPLRPRVFSSARRSNTGSMTRHGGHVEDVKKPTRTRYLLSKDANDDAFVQICMGALTVDAPVAGADEEAPDCVAILATDCSIEEAKAGFGDACAAC
jgi:hypothetical protein